MLLAIFSLYFPLLYLSVHSWFSAFLLLRPLSCSGDPSTIKLFHCYFRTAMLLLLQYCDVNIWYAGYLTCDPVKGVSTHWLRTTALTARMSFRYYRAQHEIPYTVLTQEPEVVCGCLPNLHLFPPCVCFLKSPWLATVVHHWVRHPGKLFFTFVFHIFDGPLPISSWMTHSSVFQTSQHPLISQS